jgi:hypothetical protein
MARSETGPDFIEALARGIAVIRAFAPSRPAMALSEVAEATGLARPTARRILLTLQELGYARLDDGAWSLTPRTMTWLTFGAASGSISSRSGPSSASSLRSGSPRNGAGTDPDPVIQSDVRWGRCCRCSIPSCDNWEGLTINVRVMPSRGGLYQNARGDGWDPVWRAARTVFDELQVSVAEIDERIYPSHAVWDTGRYRFELWLDPVDASNSDVWNMNELRAVVEALTHPASDPEN